MIKGQKQNLTKTKIQSPLNKIETLIQEIKQFSKSDKQQKLYTQSTRTSSISMIYDLTHHEQYVKLIQKLQSIQSLIIPLQEIQIDKKNQLNCRITIALVKIILSLTAQGFKLVELIRKFHSQSPWKRTYSTINQIQYDKCTQNISRICYILQQLQKDYHEQQKKFIQKQKLNFSYKTNINHYQQNQQNQQNQMKRHSSVDDTNRIDLPQQIETSDVYQQKTKEHRQQDIAFKQKIYRLEDQVQSLTKKNQQSRQKIILMTNDQTRLQRQLQDQINKVKDLNDEKINQKKDGQLKINKAQKATHYQDKMKQLLESNILLNQKLTGLEKNNNNNLTQRSLQELQEKLTSFVAQKIFNFSIALPSKINIFDKINSTDNNLSEDKSQQLQAKTLIKKQNQIKTQNQIGSQIQKLKVKVKKSKDQLIQLKQQFKSVFSNASSIKKSYNILSSQQKSKDQGFTGKVVGQYNKILQKELSIVELGILIKKLEEQEQVLKLKSLKQNIMRTDKILSQTNENLKKIQEQKRSSLAAMFREIKQTSQLNKQIQNLNNLVSNIRSQLQTSKQQLVKQCQKNKTLKLKSQLQYKQLQINMKNQLDKLKQQKQMIQAQLRSIQNQLKAQLAQSNQLQQKNQQINFYLNFRTSQLSKQKQLNENLTQKLNNLQKQYKQLQNTKQLQKLSNLKTILLENTSNSINRSNYQLSHQQNDLKHNTDNEINQSKQSLQSIYQNQLEKLENSYNTKFQQIKLISKKYSQSQEIISSLKSQLNQQKHNSTLMKQYLKKIHKVSINYQYIFDSNKKQTALAQLEQNQQTLDKYCQLVHISWIKAIQFFAQRLNTEKSLGQTNKNISQQILKAVSSIKNIVSGFNSLKVDKMENLQRKLKQIGNSQQGLLAQMAIQLLKFIKNTKTTKEYQIESINEINKKNETQLKRTIDQKNKQVSLLQSRLQKNLQEKEGTNEQLSTKVKQMQQKVKSLQVQNDKERKALNSQVNELKLKMTQINEINKQKLQQYTVQKQSLSKQLLDTRQLNEDLNKILQDKQKQIFTLTTNLSLFKSKDQRSLQQISNLQNLDKQNKQKIKSFQKQNQTLSAAILKLQTKLENLQDDYNNLQAERVKIKSQLQQSKKQLITANQQKYQIQQLSRSTQNTKSVQLRNRQQEITNLKSKEKQLQLKLTDFNKNKSHLEVQLAQSNTKFKEIQDHFQSLKQQHSALQQKSAAEVSKLKQQSLYLNNLIKKISKQISRKVNTNIQITPQNILQTLQTFNPSIGMKLITSSVLLGLDKERSQIANKIQNFMQKTIKRTDIIYKFQPSFKSFMHILVSKQYNTTAFFIIYKTSRGKIFGSFSESLLKKTFLFSLPYQNQGQMQRHQLQKDDKQISFYMGQKKSETISSIAVQQGKFLVYGANQMTVSIRDLTNPIKGNSDVLGGRYFQNVDWRKIFRQNDESKVTISELEFHRVQFE